MKIKTLIKGLFSIFNKNPKVMSSEETVDYILNNKISIGRYGDGELALIMGEDLSFQKHSEELSTKLAKIKTNDKFLVCIPNIFSKKNFNKNTVVENEYKFWRKSKFINGYLWKKIFNNQVLGDAFISRFYIRYKDKSRISNYVDKFKMLWKDRNLLIVEGENTKVGCENDLLKEAKSIRRIICPSKDAFQYYDLILKSIEKNYNDGDLILIALGPTATVLAYDLSEKGMQALDLGHFDIEYEWFLAGVNEKVPVKDKHVNECNSQGTHISKSPTYEKEIVDVVEKTIR